MRSKIDPRKLIKTCEACPSQWEYEEDSNTKIIIHYRHDNLNILKYSDHKTETLLELLGVTGDGFNGFMTTTELNNILAAHSLTTDPNFFCEEINQFTFSLDDDFENSIEIIKK